MTMEQAVRPEKKFVPAILPWLVAAGAFLLYLWTLNYGVSYTNLQQVARTSGWIDWQPEVFSPAFWLITYPFRWLPPLMIPLALNLFSAVCAVLTLALLARSVALLPHDRTLEQREREHSEFSQLSIRRAWLPPLMAVLVCGLQLTFWQCATTTTNDLFTHASSEMFDLLLFAYVIRCVLESRIDEGRPWLFRASFVCGMAMANNWSMIAYFPLLVVALVWVKGLSFFNGRWLSLMFLWGLAGLSLYLLLPLVRSLADLSHVPFWSALKANLAFQKSALFGFPFNKTLILSDDPPYWCLGLSSILPLLVLGIRWPSRFGDTSHLGVAMTVFVVRIGHIALFLFCLWVALGSKLSPHHLPPHMAFLTLYYMGALAIGYFSGYLLLVFRPKPNLRRRPPMFLRLLNSTVHAGVWVLLVLVPGLLLALNLPTIRALNGPLFEQQAALQAEKLPAEGGVILSDDTARLYVLRSFLTRSGRSKDFLFLESGSLETPAYIRYLTSRHVPRLAHTPPSLDSMSLIQWMGDFASSNSVYYLHPSFGYYFEAFYPEPHGLVYRLFAYRTNTPTLEPPPLTDNVVAENEAFWTKAAQEAFQPLLALLNPSAPPQAASGILYAITHTLRLETESEASFGLLGATYSRALNTWGVEMQKKGQFTKAAAHFDTARKLNPNNVAAGINLEFNKTLQGSGPVSPEPEKTLEDQFGIYRSWDQVVNFNGPFDEPRFCYKQGLVFAQGGNYRQAAIQFARAKTLLPADLRPRLWLARIYEMAQMPDSALKELKEIHAQADVATMDRTNQAMMLSLETTAYLQKNDVPSAQAVVRAAISRNPGMLDFVALAANTFMNLRFYTNTIELLDQVLQKAPNDVTSLLNKGFSYLQLEDYQKAIPPLTQALLLDTNNYAALIDRGICYLKTDQLDAAKRDYDAAYKITLQSDNRRAFQVYYGLGDIAYRQQDTNAAIRHYNSYLASSPSKPDEIKEVQKRLKELSPGAR